MLHKPVLFEEVITGLDIKPNGIYVDGTFGRGGHAAAILARLDKSGQLILLDKDPEAIEVAKGEFQDPRVTIKQSSFANLEDIVNELSLIKKVDGIFCDLGVSSPQLDDATRGFSFMKDGPLDMRMNPQAGISAAEWINSVDETVLADILWRYGDERFSRRIAKAIVTARNDLKFTTTRQLAEVIKVAHPKWDRRIHPATKSFQAIRIFINNELKDLESLLAQSLDVLKIGGRVAIISFHSLEDRIVKLFMRKACQGDEIPKGVPVKGAGFNVRGRLVARCIKSSETEVNSNPRARSARLRIMEKIA